MSNNFDVFAQCTICGHDSLHALKGFEACWLVQCNNCRFVFVHRIPTEHELLAHYSLYPRSFDVSDITIKRYNELLDTFEAYRKHNRILDVGAGNCLFLIEAQKRKWQVFGTDYGQSSVDIGNSHGITMQQGKLNSEWWPADFFDVIVSFETIEHVNAPREEIAHMKTLLRHHGLVYLTTPNFNSVERYLLKANYNAIAYPEHLSYFSKSSMHYLLAQQGFKRIKSETTGISPTRIKTSWQMKHNRPMTELFVSHTSTDERLRHTFEANGVALLVKNSLNGLLTFFGIGNSLKVLYKKMD